jgi:hypothetical protein
MGHTRVWKLQWHMSKRTVGSLLAVVRLWYVASHSLMVMMAAVTAVVPKSS